MLVERFNKRYSGIIFDSMKEPVEEKMKSMMFAEDTAVLTTEEDITLQIMHRFNIDAETLDCMPACKDSLQSLLWPKKRE